LLHNLREFCIETSSPSRSVIRKSGAKSLT
jgi:hypothetical protein